MELIEDTLFSDFDEAMAESIKNNKIDTYNKLQICYYLGEKIAGTSKNLIHLDANNISDNLIRLGTRPPTKLKVSNEMEVEYQLKLFFEKKDSLCRSLKEKVIDQCIDFKPPYRIYMSADYGGQVVLNVYRYLCDAFSSIGCEVFFDVNDDILLMDDHRRLSNIADFRPNIVFSINRLRNNIVNDKTVTFTWFMDPTLTMYDDTVFECRDRDFFYYLIDNFIRPIANKGVPDKQMAKQSFATNPAYLNGVYKHEDTLLERENKIVFIGHEYFSMSEPSSYYSTECRAYRELKKLFDSGELNENVLNELSVIYLNEGVIKRQEHLEMFVFPALVRIEVLKWVVQQDNYELEIYGNGWENIDELSAFSKGALNSDEEVKKVYDKSRYALLAHPMYFYQQRLMEASGSGCIPLVYKGFLNKEEFCHYNNCLVFHDRKSLIDIIGGTPKEPVDIIAKDLCYSSIAERTINIMKDFIIYPNRMSHNG